MTAITTLELIFPPEYKPQQHMSKSLRGAICALDPNNALLCQREEGKFLYRYPKVHYRWDREQYRGYVVGFCEGAEYLLNLNVAGKVLLLADDNVPVVGVNIKTAPLVFAESDVLRRYRFLSPWLPFKPEAYDKFHQEDRDTQQATLDRLARNHLVSAMRDLEQEPGFKVQAAVGVEETSFVLYKDIGLFGVWGTLVCNVDLPDGIALGRKVSYGNGWIKVP